jgi:hypothetical protein
MEEKVSAMNFPEENLFLIYQLLSVWNRVKEIFRPTNEGSLNVRRRTKNVLLETTLT